MLAEAKARIADTPGKYVNHIYGETENGGTSYLIISHVPFDQLGLPAVPSKPVATASETVMEGTLPFAFGWAVVLSAVAGLVRLRERGTHKRTEPELLTMAATAPVEEQPAKEQQP
jgi:hypothetical protein